MVKQKQTKDMKTSEILDELNNDPDESRIDELDEELISRYPFNYYFETKFEELEEEIKELKKLLSHDHKDGDIVIKL